MAYQICIIYDNKTHFQLLGSTGYFRVLSLSNILKLRKNLFKKPTFGKMPFFPTKNFGNCLSFVADSKSVDLDP